MYENIAISIAISAFVSVFQLFSLFHDIIFAPALMVTNKRTTTRMIQRYLFASCIRCIRVLLDHVMLMPVALI